jgi:hypothetical protein
MIALKRVLLGIFLAAGTLGAVAAIDRLPYSPLRDDLADTLSFPGVLVARMFYPEGVHTGHGAPNWGYVVFWSNIFFYVAFWSTTLWLLRFPRKNPRA